MNQEDKAVHEVSTSRSPRRPFLSQGPVLSSVETFLIDEQGIITASQGFTMSRLGCHDKLALGQSIYSLCLELPDLLTAIKRSFLGESVTLETRHEGLIFFTSFSPLISAQEKIISVIGVSYDITENKKVEETVLKNEFRLRTLFNSAHDAIFTMDHRRFIDCNEATLRIFQCTKEQIIGQTPQRFSTATQPDGRSSEESAQEKLDAVLAGKSLTFEWRHIRYDGTPFAAEVSLNKIDLENNEVLIQAIVRDVSERKKAEEENKRLAIVANTTTNMVVLADGEGKIEWVNPAFTKVTGYGLDEIVGKKPGSFLRGPDTDAEMVNFMREKTDAGQGFRNVELVNYNKSGHPYWVSIEVHPIHDPSGKVFQFIAIQSDITERKSNQQALLDRNQDLIKINTELDRFVYSASHDLRAPISSLLGLIQVARLEKDRANIDQLLALQEKSLLRMDRFIKDIVDYSRNTRLGLELEAVNFETIVSGVFEQLQFMENVKRINRDVTIQQTGTFFTSATRLDIIFNNLISNALKYADLRKEQPFVKVNIQVDEKTASITIQDNGEGIPVEAGSKIFDMFYRASPQGSGSGLGLYIVKEAIEKIGGKISFQSHYGKGTEFFVEIPNLQ
jgi:PAS domain S-box-containing protein